MNPPTRIACVGASITFGLGLPDRRENCYPAVLGRLLGEEYQVRNFGYAGATAGRHSQEPYWRTPSMTSTERFEPHQVVIALGTNDAQHQYLEWLNFFEQDLSDLATHFMELPTVRRVSLVLPPPVFEPLAEISIKRLDDAVRPAVSRVADSLGMPSIDGYAPFLNRPELFPDNLHPNVEGARLLAELVYRSLRAAKH